MEKNTTTIMGGFRIENPDTQDRRIANQPEQRFNPPECCQSNTWASLAWLTGRQWGLEAGLGACAPPPTREPSKAGAGAFGLGKDAPISKPGGHYCHNRVCRYYIPLY